MSQGMMNFFRRIQPQGPVLRHNYFIQVDDKLAWSESIGSEDAEDGVGWFTAEKNKAIEHHWFRSERQSLRRYVTSSPSSLTLPYTARGSAPPTQPCSLLLTRSFTDLRIL